MISPLLSKTVINDTGRQPHSLQDEYSFGNFQLQVMILYNYMTSWKNRLTHGDSFDKSELRAISWLTNIRDLGQTPFSIITKLTYTSSGVRSYCNVQHPGNINWYLQIHIYWLRSWQPQSPFHLPHACALTHAQIVWHGQTLGKERVRTVILCQRLYRVFWVSFESQFRAIKSQRPTNGIKPTHSDKPTEVSRVKA